MNPAQAACSPTLSLAAAPPSPNTTERNTNPTVEYLRGSDYGGGVGSVLYTMRGTTPSFTHENRRGDVVAKTNASGSLTVVMVRVKAVRPEEIQLKMSQNITGIPNIRTETMRRQSKQSLISTLTR